MACDKVLRPDKFKAILGSDESKTSQIEISSMYQKFSDSCLKSLSENRNDMENIYLKSQVRIAMFSAGMRASMFSTILVLMACAVRKKYFRHHLILSSGIGIFFHINSLLFRQTSIYPIEKKLTRKNVDELEKYRVQFGQVSLIDDEY